MRLGQPDLSAKVSHTASPQVSSVDPRAYRINRKLDPGEQAELVALYQAGVSMLELSRKFEYHRHTVMRLLQKSGVEIRPQKLMTHELVSRATALYTQDLFLEEVGRFAGSGSKHDRQGAQTGRRDVASAGRWAPCDG
jgi:hypothetical protein